VPLALIDFLNGRDLFLGLRHVKITCRLHFRVISLQLCYILVMP
jgi:hypothetical protein